MKNKNGKMSVLSILGIVAIALVAVYLISPSTITNILGTTPAVTPSTTTGGTNIVTTNPIISVQALDKLASGTLVGLTGSQYSINDGGFNVVTLGTTTVVPGQKLSLFLVNGTQYHNVYLPSFVTEVGSFPLTQYFDKNATVTENMYNTVGQVMSNGNYLDNYGVNQTRLGNGATYTWKDEMTASSLSSTNDMTCILEVTDGLNASTTPQGAILSGGSGVTYIGASKPSWYSVNNSNANVYLYDVKALNTPATQTFTVTLNSKSTGSFNPTVTAGGPGFMKTCYTKENFIDPNTGKPTFAVADSNGNVKSIARYKYFVAFT
jgi:hypothetical protein